MTQTYHDSTEEHFHQRRIDNELNMIPIKHNKGSTERNAGIDKKS